MSSREWPSSTPWLIWSLGWAWPWLHLPRGLHRSLRGPFLVFLSWTGALNKQHRPDNNQDALAPLQCCGQQTDEVPGYLPGNPCLSPEALQHHSEQAPGGSSHHPPHSRILFPLAVTTLVLSPSSSPSSSYSHPPFRLPAVSCTEAKHRERAQARHCQERSVPYRSSSSFSHRLSFLHFHLSLRVSPLGSFHRSVHHRTTWTRQPRDKGNTDHELLPSSFVVRHHSW